MKSILKIALAAMCLCVTLTARSQADSSFKISGAPIVKIFSAYSAGLGEYNDISGFQLSRAYLGYGFNMTSKLSGKVIFDAATSAETTGVPQSRNSYIKNAYLEWNDGPVRIEAGLHNFLFFGLQERLWGYRFIEQQFMALYGMAPAADLGITTQVRITKWLSADVSVTNGEGYKLLNNDNRYRYSGALILTPLSGVTLRVYADSHDAVPQQYASYNSKIISFYAGYKSKAFSIGAEYDKQHRRLDDGAKYTNRLEGFSVYALAPIDEKLTVYGRFDRTIVAKAGWITSYGQASTGNYIIAGIEYRPIKQLRLSPNYRWGDNLSPTGKSQIYLSAEFNW